MSEFDGSPVLNWWKKGSSCDAVGGQDGGTLYPGDDDYDDNDDYNDDDYDDDDDDALAAGQCRDDSDCTPWAPSCSPLGYCRGGVQVGLQLQC